MQITQAMLDVCEEALYHLRQDVSLPSLADAPTDTSMEWVKCRKAFGYAAVEVLSAHDWRFARGVQSVQDKVDGWPENIRKVLVYCLARELAVQVAGRTEDLKNWHQLYNRFLFDAKLKDLEEDKSSDQVAKEVVATLRGYFSEESKDIPRSMVSIYERVDAVKESAFREVLASHEWQGKEDMEDGDDLPPVARAAWIVLIEQKLAVACGFPPEAALKLGEDYLLKLVQARAVDLESQHSDDPVVAEVVAGIRPFFAFDQKNLPLTMVSVYERVDAVRESAFREILAAHNWQGKEDMESGDDLPAQARAAWIALMQQKLCVACGLTAEAAASFETIWRAKLKEARVSDLETTPVPEGVAGEVLTLIRDSFDPTETNLPMDLQTLADRVERMKPIAMKEVLSAHPWAFAMDEDCTRSGRLEEEGLQEYVWWIPAPEDAMKIVAVYGKGGELLEWEQVRGQIRAVGQIFRVTYVRRVDDLAEFSPDAYRLVVLRLAADMSRAMSMRASVQNLHENIYRDALAEAKCRDTRQSNPSAKSIWGGNYYARVMGGDADPFRR